MSNKTNINGSQSGRIISRKFRYSDAQPSFFAAAVTRIHRSGSRVSLVPTAYLTTSITSAFPAGSLTRAPFYSFRLSAPSKSSHRPTGYLFCLPFAAHGTCASAAFRLIKRNSLTAADGSSGRPGRPRAARHLLTSPIDLESFLAIPIILWSSRGPRDF
jgi:hypothetical protein